MELGMEMSRGLYFLYISSFFAATDEQTQTATHHHQRNLLHYGNEISVMTRALTGGYESRKVQTVGCRRATQRRAKRQAACLKALAMQAFQRKGRVA